jgi:hypothetical protein
MQIPSEDNCNLGFVYLCAYIYNQCCGSRTNTTPNYSWCNLEGTFYTLGSAGKCEGMNPHTLKWTPTLGVGVQILPNL